MRCEDPDLAIRFAVQLMDREPLMMMIKEKAKVLYTSKEESHS